MNTPAILIANGSAVALLFILLFSTRRTVHYGLLDHKLFLVMILSTLFQCVAESTTLMIDGRAGLDLLARILNSLLYLNNISFAFLWTVYVDYKLFSDADRLKRRGRFVVIPAVLVGLGSLVNLFTPVFFSIGAGNVYQRTSLFFIPFALTYLYLAYGVFLVYYYRNKVHKYLFLPAVVFMIPIVIASVLQTLFYGYSLIWLGTAIALASLYINVQNEVSYVDAMTGLFTRQYLLQYLNQQFRSPDAGGQLAGIMLDIDRFKEINDSYGHLMGDEAIAAAGRLLRASLQPRGVAARYAGDEFVIFQPSGGESAVLEVIRRINENAERLNHSGQNLYQLHFSVGYSEYRDGDTIDTFLGRLDAAMYADKRRKAGTRRRSTDV